MHRSRGFVCVLAVVFFFGILGTASAETDAERRARLEAELADIERQMLAQQVLLDDKQSERQTLERDVAILDAQIQKAQLGIRARTLEIEALGGQIIDKELTIDELNERMRRQRDSLAQILRRTQQIDDFSLAEVMLAGDNLSKFFEDLDSFHTLKSSLRDSFDVLTETKDLTSEQRNVLEDRQKREVELRALQELEKQEVERAEAEKSRILEVTKGEEAAYQQMLAQSQQTAAQLRAQLFELLGGGGGIPFPDAVALAETAGRLTGIAPALILAILEQETNIGMNLGSCVYNEMRGGRAVMHPDRDAPIFVAIAAELGFDPNRQQVSCPIMQGGVPYGWGGAMGPSQFIPSTWAMYGGFEGGVYNRSNDLIRSLLGKSTASNPFNNQDAFLATALLLRDNGAASDPRLAALRYYAGWGGASRPENQFYGDQVMQRMQRLANEIQILKGA